MHAKKYRNTSKSAELALLASPVLNPDQKSEYVARLTVALKAGNTQVESELNSTF